MVSDSDVYAAIREHLSGFWPGRDQEEFVWTLGPIGRTLPRFRVRRVGPGSRQDPWVYVSVGAWEATADEPHGAEFFLLSSSENPQHVELLAMVANLHADPRYRLDVGSVVDIGRPWAERSKADHLLVSLPYPYGPSFERCDVGDRHMQFRWLVPITSAEAALVREQGMEALERRLESSRVDVLSPRRRSSV